MEARQLLQPYRRFLLGVTIAIFAGSFVELLLVNHVEELAQWIAIICSCAGLVCALWVWFWASSVAIRIFNGVMRAAIVASVLGLYFHLAGNYAFSAEIRPNASVIAHIFDAFKGANPLLAPGILALGGMLGLAATYRPSDIS